jgi:YD repeat-containing protein
MKTRNSNFPFPRLAFVLLVALPILSARAVETVTYSYDAAGRLTKAAYTGGAKIDYVYDANGNLLQRTVMSGGAVTYTLIYRAGTGGTVDGLGGVTQQVARGASGTAVAAAASDAGAVFGRWSDGHGEATRTDTNVQADLDVTARFRSTGGADLDWYAARGLAPGGGENWADVDARAVPGKGTTLRHENIADTDPADTNDVFRILSISNGPPPTVQFQPGSTRRVYTFQFTENLLDGASWSNVPGVPPRPGANRVDQMQDVGGDPARQIHYRIQVEVP